ncbi:hypothetical protein EX192_02675 [Staphylococcus epidermidis]|nr:hypothetical protein [Staphylococcus epidermidis]
MSFYKFIYWLLYLQYFVLLDCFLRGQLHPVVFSVVFSLSCPLKSLAKILCVYMYFYIKILKKIRPFRII